MRFTRWDQESTTGETNAILDDIIRVLLARITCQAERERLTSCLIDSSVLPLCNYDLAYTTISVNDAIAIRQILAFFQKRVDLVIPGVDKEEVACDTFVEAERLCADSNEIFELERLGRFKFPSKVTSQLYAASRKIASVLGPVPGLHSLKVRFGPGATTHVPKRTASARRKLSSPLACSEDLYPRIQECLGEMQGWVAVKCHPDRILFESLRDDNESSEHSKECLAPNGDAVIGSCQVPVSVESGKLAFVPKNAKTCRTVVVEPVVNSMFQLGIGAHIAHRLKRHGVDITDQSLNQRLAREGSLLGRLATLDLSSASDCISIGLIKSLFPLEWVDLLLSFRTGKVSFNGMTINLAKVSSMGNGFTFPLETLIFYALALSCVNEGDEDCVNAYGDDIIVPVYAYQSLCELLTCVGFKVNEQKSFASGPFRESCGADYLSGINIRPFYVKDVLSGHTVFRLHNQFVRNGDDEVAAILQSYLDESLILWGPDGYGDGHLVGTHQRSACKRSRGWSGYTFESYTFKPRRDFTVFPGDRVYPSYSIYAAEPHDEKPLRSTSNGHQRANALRDWAINFKAKLSPAHAYSRDGYLGVSIPGLKGYKSVKIYTLN